MIFLATQCRQAMRDIDVKDKKVLIRVDFNVPLNDQFEITDDTRMQGALPTIRHVLSEGGSVILMSHLGRPQKKRNPDGTLDRNRFSLQHVVAHLSQLLNIPVLFARDTVGEDARQKCADLKSGQVLVLENTRFEAGESKGDVELGRAMAQLADVYINDAFGSAHRAHASTTTVAQFFAPDQRAYGFLMEKEIENANKVLIDPPRPLVAIVGGAKVSDKILLLERLLEFVDKLIVGGGMAYTFIKAKGGQIGHSLVEDDKIALALKLLELADQRGVDFLLPDDSIVADKFAADASTAVVHSNRIEQGWMGLDIGPAAVASFSAAIAEAKCLLWNGPMGVFEMDAFSEGTRSIATAVAKATQGGAFSLIGGGDSVAAVKQMNLANQVSFVSTGGGAMLEYLEGKELPGIKAISDNIHSSS